jgi:hypothetical protein
MSHFTTLKTRLVSRDHVLRALQDMGLNYEVGELSVEGSGGKRMSVEIKVPARGSNWSFGFRRQGDSYELVADWWGIHDIRQQEFLPQLTQRYGYHVAKEQFAKDGWTLVEEEVQQDNTIHLFVRRST